MTFKNLLSSYMTESKLTVSELSRISGLSVSTIMRYKNGSREPGPDSKQLDQLARAMSEALTAAGIKTDVYNVLNALRASLSEGLSVDYTTYIMNINTLLASLDIKNSTLAKALNFDPSHVSKILTEKRRPGDISRFSADIASFISEKYTTDRDIAILSRITGQELSEGSDPQKICNAILLFLTSNRGPVQSDPLANFLNSISAFDLDAFISSISFTPADLPKISDTLPSTRVYDGIKEMMRAELDFIESTYASPNTDDCITYSDMPIAEMAQNEMFYKKWMLGMAMLLKKGVHFSIIHDVNRPFPEMMLGLESNMPMYMTGQISPYYLPGIQRSAFSHMLKVSSGAALLGFGINGHQASGRYKLFTDKKDIEHYRTNAQQLLAKANSLMDIYGEERKKEFAAFYKEFMFLGSCKCVLSSLPLFTMDETMLEDMICNKCPSKKEAGSIMEFYSFTKKRIIELLKNCKLTMVVPELTRDQFDDYSLSLSVSELFLSCDINYTYEEYLKHLEDTREWAAHKENVILVTDKSPAFRNISYIVTENDRVIVSKDRHPTIHFVISHKKMVHAFMNFIPPIREQ